MNDIIGPIEFPFRVFSNSYADLQGGGLITFISNIIRLAVVAAGIFAFLNLILAGFEYISSAGDTKKTAQALARINMSLIGLVIIVASFAVAAIIGLILFGDAGAILNPRIYGPGNMGEN